MEQKMRSEQEMIGIIKAVHYLRATGHIEGYSMTTIENFNADAFIYNSGETIPLEVKTSSENLFHEDGTWDGHEWAWSGKLGTFLCTEDEGGNIKKGIPEEVEGKIVYPLPSMTEKGSKENSKWHKLMKSHSAFALVAPDGIVYFDRETLPNAAVTECWNKNFKTTEFRKPGEKPVFLKKMLIDLQKGTVIRITGRQN